MSSSELHEAARSGDLSKARELLSQGDPEYVDCVDSRGQTPLLLASREGHLEMVRMLITEFHANTTGQNDSGCTALMVAARAGHDEVVKSLLADPNVPIYVTDKKGQAVLHHSCAGGNISVLRALTEKSEVTINLIEDDQNDMPLHVAACNGIVLRLLLEEFNCDINARGHLGRTVLHIACSMGNVSLVKMLISQHHADIYVRDAEFNPPLHVAALYGQEDVVLTLLKDFGVDPGTRGHRGRTLLHSACGGGNVSLVQTIIRKYNGNTNAFDNLHHRTPIHIAAEYGRKEVVMMLIEEFGINISSVINTDWYHRRDYHARKCLVHSACKGRNVHLVETLILKEYSLSIEDAPLVSVYNMLLSLFDTYNSDPENWNENSACIGNLINILFSKSVSSLNHQNKTSLDVHNIISNRQKELVSKLIRCNFCVEACPELHKTLFYIACSWDDVHLIKTLLSDYNIDVGAKDDQNNTPLHVAALGGAKEVSLMLITEFRSNVSIRGHLGRTVLHCACIGGNVDLVFSLTNFLKESVDFTVRDHQNNTPLHVAALHGQEKVLMALLNDFKCDFNIRGYLGRSLLHSACISGDVDLVCSLTNYLKERSIVDFSDRDYQNNTPLYAAAMHAKLDVVVTLVEKFGCDLALIRDHERKSLLHLACIEGNINMAKCICKYISPLIVDSNGDTPLHEAASLGHNECISILLAHNAPILIRNNFGKTPIDVANNMAKDFFNQYMTINKNKIFYDYDDIKRTRKEVLWCRSHHQDICHRQSWGREELHYRNLKKRSPFRLF